LPQALSAIASASAIEQFANLFTFHLLNLPLVTGNARPTGNEQTPQFVSASGVICSIEGKGAVYSRASTGGVG
jgi:hypothetical protein